MSSCRFYADDTVICFLQDSDSRQTAFTELQAQLQEHRPLINAAKSKQLQEVQQSTVMIEGHKV